MRNKKKTFFQMTSANRSTRVSSARENNRQLSLGTHAPLNTTTRRFYSAQGTIEIRTPGGANPNGYV